jgi:hypothetical protein
MTVDATHLFRFYNIITGQFGAEMVMCDGHRNRAEVPEDQILARGDREVREACFLCRATAVKRQAEPVTQGANR